MVLSFKTNYEGDHEVTFHVFSDQTEKISELKNVLKNTDIVHHKIPAYGWPDATLLRYEVISEAYKILNEDILVHIDADMIFEGNPVDLFRAVINEKMLFVQHPGFYRPHGRIEKVKYYFSFRSLIRDLYLIISNGGIGAWEKRKASSAYIPRKFRRQYFCGAVWAGKNRVVKEFCLEASRRTKKDLSNNLVARWHDESHLNRYAINHPIIFLDPRFCFDETYPQLKKLNPVIVAVDKSIQQD